ncbi:MAG TPA: AMP-binding protein [Burkholderiales bacterium]|nr:AMP-binding protein [Burkholderiales bacterium]
MSIARILERWVQASPDKTALHWEGVKLSYAELWNSIDVAARSLPVRKGERVAWLGYNDPALLVLLFALARLGAILVPLNWRLTAAEHREILADCSPTLLVCGSEFAAHGAQLGVPLGRLDAPVGPLTEAMGDEHDDVLIVYTSGTTGKPKGAVLTQSALVWNGLNSFHAHDLRADDHVLTVLPMFHVGGLNIQTLPALFAGATVTLHKKFDPGAWLSAVAGQRPTLSLLVPAAMRAVIEHPAWPSTDLSSLRLLNTGSMVVPDALIRAFHARGVPVGQIYGATETAPIAIALRGEDALRKPGSAGKPVPHSEAKLVDGEIWIRGPAVMRAYWNDREGLTPDGWFRSGDLGRIDEDGYWWIVGRSKDLIISGGENIHPAEIENVLADCPVIAEAAVVGVSDPRWGEAACAAVVLKPGSVLVEPELLKLFEGRLARYKHPRRIVSLSSLPKNALGKVQKGELRRLLDAQLNRTDSI